MLFGFNYEHLNGEEADEAFHSWDYRSRHSIPTP